MSDTIGFKHREKGTLYTAALVCTPYCSILPMDPPSALPSLTYFLTPLIQFIACSGVLYGASVLQSYYYMLNCDNDPWWTKLFVVLLFLLETIGTAFSFFCLNVYTVGVLNNPSTLLKLDWTICATPFLISIIQFMVSGYYIGRMYMFTRNTYLAILAGTLSITRIGGFMYAQHGMCEAETWMSYRLDHQARTSATIAMSIGPVVDGITSLAMGIYLYRTSPAFKRTRNIITWLIILTVNTGLVLVAVGICTLIAFLKLSSSLAYAGLFVISGKLYANSLLATLNGRHALRTRLQETVTLRTSGMGLSNLSPGTHLDSQPVRIEISQEVYDSEGTFELRNDMGQEKENQLVESSV